MDVLESISKSSNFNSMSQRSKINNFIKMESIGTLGSISKSVFKTSKNISKWMHWEGLYLKVEVSSACRNVALSIILLKWVHWGKLSRDSPLMIVYIYIISYVV